MKILGISAFYHDSAAALVVDGDIFAAAQEERFTRKKHDHNFPINALQYCLSEAGIKSSEIDYVSFYDKPFLKFERILETYLSSAPVGIRSFIKAMPLWLKKKLWIKELIRTDLEYKGPILFPKHHESHAASAFYPSPFKEAAFLTIDGVGEWSTASYGIGRNNRIELMADIRFPHSLGLLYSAFTYYTGFKVNSGEYKVMGLAAYGKPKFKNLIYEYLIDVKDDGSFRMNMDYFDYTVGLKMTSDKFADIFGGPPRKPESELTQREMDLARSVQEVIEETIIKMAQNIKQETGMNNLCLAGGVALNCVANGKLLRKQIFDDIWIQPAAGDAGGSVGAALLAWYQYLQNERQVYGRSDSMKGSYLGPKFSDDSILSFLENNSFPYEKLSEKTIPEKITEIISAQKVIGWFQNRMEFGPRALGSRSIIGDARSPKMQEIMNLKIKYRESFRPFAPSVLEEKVSDWFQIDRSSPYMLLVANVSKKKQKVMSNQEENYFGLEKLYVSKSDIPAVTHVDYSARVHTVNNLTNPIYYQTISRFNQESDCPVIINTSFNVRGEPIVCTPEDAYRCFMRTEMDYLLLGNFLLEKECQPEFTEADDWKREFELD